MVGKGLQISLINTISCPAFLSLAMLFTNDDTRL